MNCISCGEPIETVYYPYCNGGCMFHHKMYKRKEPDPLKIYEVSNVIVEVVR